MTPPTLEERVSALEAKFGQSENTAQTESPWWEKIFGTFADSPDYDEAMRLGAEYRRAQLNPADHPDAVEF